MDSCHFWDDNYFHLLFDVSTPPYVAKIMEGSQDLVMTTTFQRVYSPILMCYVDDHLDRNGSTYLYSLD